MTTVWRCGSTISPSDGCVEAVDDAVDEATTDGDHDAGRRDDRDVDPSHRRQLTRPRAGRVHDHVRLQQDTIPRSPITSDGALDGVAPHDELLDLDEGPDRGPVRARRGEEGQAQVPRIEDAVWHLDASQHVPGQGRLERANLARREGSGRDPGACACLEERLAISEAGIVHGDEQPAVQFEDLRRDPRQDVPLDDALGRRFRVLDRVTGAGMEEPVVSPGRSRRHLAALDDRDVDAAQAQVVGDRGTARTGPDDEHTVCRPRQPVRRHRR